MQASVWVQQSEALDPLARPSGQSASPFAPQDFVRLDYTLFVQALTDAYI